MEEAQKKWLCSKINNKIKHGNLHPAKSDPLVNIGNSSTWLKYGNITPRNEALYCYMQDRNMFLRKEERCLHCQVKRKTVDHLATQYKQMLGHDYMRRHNEAL